MRSFLAKRAVLTTAVVTTAAFTLALAGPVRADPVEEGKAPASSLGLTPTGPVAAAPTATNAAPVATAANAAPVATAANAAPVANAAPIANTAAPVGTDGAVAPSSVPGATDGTTIPAAPPTTAYDLGKAALVANDFGTAVAKFREAVGADPNNADAHNFLAFSSRKNGDIKTAFAEYKTAIKLNPSHRGAHEYLGEAYVQIGKMTQAKTELAKLKTICGVTCEQYLDLSRTISAAKKKK